MRSVAVMGSSLAVPGRRHIGRSAHPLPTCRPCHHGAVLLADVVATSAAVAATRSRGAKAPALAKLRRRGEADEVEPVTSWLAGEPRQGRLGLGWRPPARACRGPSPGPPPAVAPAWPG